jgi:hypothetical protein
VNPFVRTASYDQSSVRRSAERHPRHVASCWCLPSQVSIYVNLSRVHSVSSRVLVSILTNPTLDITQSIELSVTPPRQKHIYRLDMIPFGGSECQVRYRPRLRIRHISTWTQSMKTQNTQIRILFSLMDWKLLCSGGRLDGNVPNMIVGRNQSQ